MFEEEREEDDQAWIDRFDNSRIRNERREEYNHAEPSDSRYKWGKVGLKLEGYILCAIEAHTIARQDMEATRHGINSSKARHGINNEQSRRHVVHGR
jgi:hypothetical protein